MKRVERDVDDLKKPIKEVEESAEEFNIS